MLRVSFSSCYDSIIDFNRRLCYSILTCVHFHESLLVRLPHLTLGSVVLRGDCHRLGLGGTGVNDSPLGSWSPYQTKKPSEGYLVAVRSVADVMSCEARLLRHSTSHHELKV